MIFFTSIDELNGNNTPDGVPCYCERIIYPDDLLLQSPLTWQGPNEYTLLIELYSVDGKTNFGDVTDKFSYYFFKNPISGKHTFNIRLEHFHELMCIHACWILKVTVSDSAHIYFQKITDRYCQTSCCDVPRGVGFAQPSVVWPDDSGPGTINIPAPPKVDECGNKYITVTTRYECYDKQTGDYYSNPGAANIINGNYTNFVFEKKLNLRGEVIEIPREIVRTYSRNCRLTRTESARQYEVDVYGIFPAWKALEVTNMLHAPEIRIDGQRYEYDGGEPFARIELGSTCDRLYRSNILLRDCDIYQNFGCSDGCNTTGGAAMAMVISQGAKIFYDEDRQLIGDKDDLLDWFRNQPGMTNLMLIDPGDYDCDFEIGFVVYGDGYMPTFVYVDGTAPGNRTYGMSEAALADLCSKIEPSCAMPVAGTITPMDDTCGVPTLGTIIVMDMPTTNIAVTWLNDWIDEGDSAITRTEKTVNITLDLSNANYPESDGLGDGPPWQWGESAAAGNVITSADLKFTIAPILFLNEQPIDWNAQGVVHDEIAGTLDFTAIGGAFGKVLFQYVNPSSFAPGIGMLIGIMDVGGRPSVDVYVNGVTVNTMGYIYYSGAATSTDSEGSYIEQTIIYNI